MTAPRPLRPLSPPERHPAPFAVLTVPILLALAGCIATPDAPEPVHTFAPVLAPSTPAEATDRSVDLTPTRSAPHLDERMSWRLSPTEWTWDELGRWTAPPAAYVDEVLTRRLFESGAFVPATRSTDLRVEPTLLAFGRTPEGVEVAVRLRVYPASGPARVLTERATASVPDDSAEAFATAIGPLLDTVCAALVENVGG